jgi:SAM-dependent methyltransferase
MMNETYQYQNDTNKQGEITFRRQLAQQEAEHPELILPTMKKRIAETVAVFHSLERRYSLSLSKNTVVGELGAERAQRVLALIDHYNLNKAFAFDISPDMLSLSEVISTRCFPKSDGTFPHQRLTLVPGDFLQAKKMIGEQPIDFMFCFATIHHFPDPRPVFQTVYSLLNDGGYFYFDREAMRSLLGLHEVARLPGYLAHGKIIERDFGILETQFSLERWLEALNIFDDWDVHLKYPLPVLEKIYNFDFRTLTHNAFIRTISRLFGGRIYGLLRKKGKIHRSQ